MPPKSPYTFTTPQSNYLKTHLAEYMKAFDGQDSVDAIPRAIETISDAFTKEFKAPDKDKKVIALSVEMWFNYKAQRIEKKRMLSVDLRVHGYDIFRQEKWESLIRPAVVEVLGHSDNRQKEWIGTVQKVGGTLWQGLTGEQRSKYEKDAKEVNCQNGTRDNKIKYADTFFKKKIKKFITDLAGICEARIMVWTIRETLEGNDRLVSVIEDDTGPKFMHENHPNDLNNVNWYGGEWLDWMEKLATPTPRLDNQRAAPARNIRDYFLRVGPSGEIEMPSPETHATGSNWASPLAKLVQIAWGRANGLKTSLIPKYKIFAADPGKYLDITTYLPSREMLKEDFVWTKPSNMPAQQLLAWAAHLYARQERRNKGENIEVFAFYVVDKRQKPHSAIVDNRQLEPTGANVGINRDCVAANSNTTRIRPDLSPDEVARTLPTLEKNIVFDVGSPGAAGGYWKSKISFLKTLCRSAEYQRLVCWLYENQTRSSLSAPDGWRSQLPWSRWTYTGRWLPSDMYDDESGFEAVEAYVRQWKENMITLAASKSNVEHFLLMIGMLSRDIFAYQFSTNDPDDADTCPPYCHNQFFNVTYHETLMKLVDLVLAEARRAVEKQAASSSSLAIAIENSNIRQPPPTVPDSSLQSGAAAPLSPSSPSGDGTRPSTKKGRQPRQNRRVKPRQPPRAQKKKAVGSLSVDVNEQPARTDVPPAKLATSTKPPIAAMQVSNPEPLPDPHTSNDATESAAEEATAVRARKRGNRVGTTGGRPTVQRTVVVAQTTAPGTGTGGCDTAASAEAVNPGRKSGRLIEKGPTTYTSKGEIFRGGKRVNGDMYDPGSTKRARYGTAM